MKKKSNSIFFSCILVISIIYSVPVYSQAGKKADKETKIWRYEIECAGVGKEGSYLIKVWSYSKKPAIASEQAKKNAIHGVIFQGFAGGGQGCVSQKPMVTDPSIEQQKAEFFNDFFADGGKYMKYIGSANDGEIGAGDRLKVGKEYKIGIIVSVLKDNLRKDLEAAGIIRTLGSGF